MRIRGLVRVDPSGIGRSDFTCPAERWMGLKREAMPMEVRFWTQTPGDKRRMRRRMKIKRYLILDESRGRGRRSLPLSPTLSV